MGRIAVGVTILLIISIIFTWLHFDLSMTTKNPRRERKSSVGWSKHPCDLPAVTTASVGLIWTCKCGRRWKNLYGLVSRYDSNYGYHKNHWEEWTAEKDLAAAEAEYRKLQW